MFRNVHIRPKLGCFVDVQESRIQVAKTSDMVIAVMKGLRFHGTKKSCFENRKLSHIVFTALLCGQFADVQELGFNLKNVQIWVVLNCKWVYLRIVRNGIIRIQNVQIREIPSSKLIDYLMHMNRVVGFETFKYG